MAVSPTINVVADGSTDKHPAWMPNGRYGPAAGRVVGT